MPKIDNPIQGDEDDPEYPVLQIEANEPSFYVTPAPDIQTLIAPYIVPTRQMPYNRVGFFTFFLTHGNPAIRIVEAQPIGIAGRVTIYTTTASAKVLLTGKRENVVASTSGTTQTFSVPIVSTMMPLVMNTCAEIWAEEISAGTDSEINVVLETFDVDLYEKELGRHYPYNSVPINQIPSDY